MARSYGKGLGHMLRVRISPAMHAQLVRRTERGQAKDPAYGMSDLVREILERHFSGEPPAEPVLPGARPAQTVNPFAAESAVARRSGTVRRPGQAPTAAADVRAAMGEFLIDPADIPVDPAKVQRYKAPHMIREDGMCAAGCDPMLDPETCLWSRDDPQRKRAGR